jgi:phage-related protein
MKELVFEGDSLNRLRDFPVEARQDAGFALFQVQSGEKPSDYKPFPTAGKGVEEIRVWDDTGTYRVMYVARFKEAVYVLHCFKKASEKTAQKDIDLANDRYSKLILRRSKDGFGKI